MSPKWTKTKIVIEITLLLQAFSCLPLVQAAYGFLRISHEVLIEIGLVLIAHHNEDAFQMFLFAFHYLGYKNVKQLSLEEIIRLTQTAC